MKRSHQFLSAIAIVVFIAHPATADWLQFRGPNGAGIAPDKNLPTTWSADSNIVWKYQMPGFGGSCPIVVGDKVILTCYSGYGLSRGEPGEQKNLKRHLVCVNRVTGKPIWTRDFPADLPEAAYQGPYITTHGYASSTPISDGKHLWVFFGKSGVYCFDLDGKQKWHVSVGDRKNGWGSGTSPILYKDLLIVNAYVESGALVALNKNSGTEAWSAKGLEGSWNTPVLVKGALGATEVALATQPNMLGFDPDTGKELWRAETYNWYVCPSLVAHDGVLYGLQHRTCVAVKAGGRGDVTKTNVLWKKNFGAVVTSPLYHDGHVYWAADGVAHCVKASNGVSVYKERLNNDADFYASPVLADGKIYYVSRNNGAYVLDASPTFKQLAHNTLKSDTSVFNASLAVSGSQLFLRSDRFLYCVGKK